jgi:hypothetical protein
MIGMIQMSTPRQRNATPESVMTETAAESHDRNQSGRIAEGAITLRHIGDHGSQ